MSPSTDPTPSVGTMTDERVGPSSVDDRPDDFFAIISGLYAALLVAPPMTAAVARTVGDPAILYLVFLGSVVLATTTVALAIRRRRGLAERLGETRMRWLPAVVAPGVVGVAGVVFLAVGEYSSTDTLLGVVTVVGGVTTGGVLGIMARSRYTKAVTEIAASHATWRAGWSDRRRRPMQLLGIVGFVGGMLVFLAQIFWHNQLLQTLAHVLIPLGAVVFTFGRTQTYNATSAGLEQQMPAARALYEWNHFEGYTVAEDAIVLHRRAPWRFPIICDRDDLDDEQSVVAALDRHLPRLPVV